MNHGFCIGIGGGSCSGKTTLAAHLAEQLGAANCAVLCFDDYYVSVGMAAAADTNFDHPDAIDWALLSQQLDRFKAGQAIDVPVYDFATHTRTERTRRVEPRPLVILEGILALAHADLRALYDHAVFVDCDEATRRARRFDRDQRERDREPDFIEHQLTNHVEPMYREFVWPSSAHADVVLSQDALGRELNGAEPTLLELCERQLGARRAAP
ncbi:MAG: uridine kinase [Pseudomonadota bacterium]